MNISQISITRKLSILILSVVIISLFVLNGFATTENSKGYMDARLLGRESRASVDLLIQTTEHPGEALIKIIKAQGCEVTAVYTLIKGLAATCPGRAITPLSRISDITYLEADDPMVFPLDVSRAQVKADLAVANFGVNGTGVKVVLIDSGINKSHVGLTGVNWGEEHVFFFDVIDGGDDGHPSSHGTRSACIVACSNSTYQGLAPGTTIVNAKVGDTGALPSAVIKALEWAVNMSADVVLANVGGNVANCDGADATSQAVNLATNKTIVIAPAGNDGPVNFTIWTPGCAETAITVGSIDEDSNVSWFSSRGPTDDGRMKPDVVAPGSSIVTAKKPSPEFDGASGTSFSGPHVTAIVALMKQARPGLSFGEAKQILKLTADDVGDVLVAQGAGRVDAEEAVNLSLHWTDVVNMTHNQAVPNPAPKGMNFNFVLNVNSTGNIAANGTTASIISITPTQLNLVNNDPTHVIGVVPARNGASTTWVMKSNKADTFTVTLNLTAVGILPQLFNQTVVVSN